MRRGGEGRGKYFDIFRNERLTVASHISINVEMRSAEAVTALSALAQEHRLALFRLLVQAGQAGMPAGRIAMALGVPNSSLSHHLAQLAEAGLVRQRREGRSLIYSADYPAMDRLLGFLTESCCAGASCEVPARNRKETTA